MITPDGWLDWAERRPGPAHKVNPVQNTASGYVPHSAVGFYRGWESRLFNPNDRASVHGWIAYDGHVIQHYPFTAACWASGSNFPNNNFIAFENEGGAPGNESEPLTEAQIDANVRIIRELAQWRGWTEFRRPADANDRSANLYEHCECARFGSAPTACPSGRIPWDVILARLSAVPGPVVQPQEPAPATTVVVRHESGVDVVLDIDEYAKGVVCSEMGTGWPFEALKAQAVIAKSYALAKRAPVLTTTQDQVFNPAKRAPDTDAAVDAVKGIYAAFNGEVVMPYYSAHCAGHTRLPSQAGWDPVADRPYLLGVPCPCGFTDFLGHGIGMCQEGARVLANQGLSFDQILRHYFQGIELLGFQPGAQPPSPALTDFQTYVVQPGDTLLAIARRFGLEWGVIFECNRGLLSDPNVLPSGCELRIPLPPPEEHVVQPGDTLFSLSRRWGCSVEAIVQFNALPSATLIRVGQVLKRPR